MTFATTDLCDDHAEKLKIAEPLFGDFGGVNAFAGPISTVQCFEDNSLVRAALEEPGNGRVLVVDGGGSRRCALLGGNLAKLAEDNGWTGVIVNGCLRDRDEIMACKVGVKALAAHPLKSNKRGLGDRDVPVRFAGIQFVPGEYLYADLDGIVVSETALA